MRALTIRPLLAAVAALLAAAGPAAAATEVRALLLDQRFTPTASPRSTPLATQRVALRGETVALQLAIRPDVATVIRPRVESATPWLAATSILRVGFVAIRRPSTGTGAAPGLYPDPLPPLAPGAGLSLDARRYGGLVLLVSVPADAEPGDHVATVVLDDGSASPPSVPLAIRVSALTATPRTDPASFSVLVLDNTEQYRTVTPVRGEGAERGRQTLAQVDAILRFLGERGVVPLRNGWATPARDGSYPSFTTPGAWWKDAAGNLARAMAIPQPARAFPVVGDGFSLGSASPAAASRFLSRAAAHWRANGYLDGRATYAFTWDEPGRAVEQRRLPAINRAVHASAPGVKTLATLWPQARVPRKRICRTFGNRTCQLSRGSDYSNQQLLDGGADDVDAPVILNHRFYGTWTSKLERQNGIDHTYDTRRLVERARSRGKEIWTYTYTIGRRGLPQLAIDAPATDVSTLLWWNALERTDGFLHWGFARFLAPRKGATRPRNPYDDPLSWTNGSLVSNGEASLIYPARSARYGLDDPTAAPVSSLRLERMRLGVESANLVRAARASLGDAAVQRELGRIFGRVRTVPGAGYTWPRYSRRAADYELVRRALIEAMESAAA